MTSTRRSPLGTLYPESVARGMLILLFIVGLIGWAGCSDDDDDDDTITTPTTTTYGVSGTVSGDVAAGVTVSLAGDAAATATTDANGDYSFAAEAGDYTVTPALAGYTFSPATRAVTVDEADVTGLDFTSTQSSSSGDLGDRTDYASVSLTSGGTYTSADTEVDRQYYAYSSSTSDTPAIKVEPGGDLTLSGCTVDKSGETADRENSGFYGFNAGVLASSSSQSSGYSGTGNTTSLTMTDCTITTDASGANGAFAFGEDASVILDHVTIVTTGSDNSRGVDATYGGTVTITNSTISTTGGSCAALATDRYENYDQPTINATNCTGTTAGTGSPGIYCTGVFTVADCVLTASGSEAAAIEGLNSITMTDTDISGADKWGVMIYQSMSGDSSPGTGSFIATGGSITNSSDGPLFFVCNTTAEISLENVTLDNSSDVLLWATTAAAGSAIDSNVNGDWGNEGGTVEFTATSQTLTGDIDLQESSSSITLELIASSYSGAINNAGSGGGAELILDSSSTWEVTDDSYLTSLSNDGGTITGSGTIYVNGVEYTP